MGLRGLSGLEVREAQADKTRFVFRRIKACVGLEGLCGPDESTRSIGERESLYVYISIYLHIYIYILNKKTYTIYDFPIQANSNKVFGAFNKTSRTKK